ncbi:hypothetical protein [Gloeobacter kilaueensis]|uniref:hypothetical protein n=1 Tax=Gloeobacter kilaueensis TaxID=1416614 RepID=UPI00040DE35D|nr:hypothetical protein [Gloeobacter kilaueensis]
MTKDKNVSSSDKVIAAKKLHEQSLELSQDIESNWLALGRLFLQISEEEKYKILGYSSWLDYVNESGYPMRGRTAYNLMKLAKYPFIEKIKHLPRTVCLSLEKVKDEAALDDILKRIDQLSEKERWLELARHDDRSRQLQRLRERKNLLLEELRKVLNEIAAIEADEQKAEEPK